MKNRETSSMWDSRNYRAFKNRKGNNDRVLHPSEEAKRQETTISRERGQKWSRRE